jgi:hypothetical protein
MWRIKLVLITVLLVSGSMPMTPAHAAPSERIDSVGDLWLDIGLGPPLVDWFNRVARPDDIARADHISEINLPDEITTGRKLVVFKSAAEAEQAVPEIADRIDILGYNLEHGPATPPDEQADPVGSVKRMHDLARQYGLTLALGPDHSFALSDGVEMAPHVDIFVLQVQRAQTDPATALDFVQPLIPELRQANPDLQISVQVRTEGDVVAIVDLIDCIKEGLDGVSILTSPDTVDIAEALVDELRTRTSAKACPEATRPASASRVEAETALVPIQDTAPSWLLIMVVALIAGAAAGALITGVVIGALVAGALGGGVVAALICASRNRAADK